jgi:alpha-tubulin suppressor-like RCC1 family protein
MMMAAAGASTGATPYKLFAWGINNNGQLGDGTQTNRSSPVQIGDAEWLSTAGDCSGHTMAIKSDYTLWSWGHGEYGKTGHNNTTDLSSPVQVGSATFSHTSCNVSGSAAINTDGELYTCGDNHSRLGLGSGAGAKSVLTKVGSKTNWVTVNGTDDHMGAVDGDGKLYTWGVGTNGRLGHGNTTTQHVPTQVGSLTNWASVSCAQSHTIALKTDGTLWAWGFNVYGMLGDGSTTSRSSPVQIGSLTTWRQANAGSYSSFGTTTGNTLFSWGWGGGAYFPKLGLNNLTTYSSPVQVPGTTWSTHFRAVNHSLCLRTDGTLWSWGRNADGRLGNGATAHKSSPIQIGSATDWESAFAGGNGSSFGFRP